MSTHKEHFGDGAYVALEGESIVLTTENGYEVTNEVFLDVDAAAALVRWMGERVREKLAAAEGK